MRIIIALLVVVTAALSFFLLEGICFRMIEKYSMLRLETCWGPKLSEDLNKYLKFLPLNHFRQPPIKSSEVEFSMLRALEEDNYACEIMSFGRPQRDDYSDFVKNHDPYRKSFRIKDLNHIRGLMLPGLKRFPTDQEVAKGWAGRKRDQIEYAKALFVDLKPYSELSYSLDKSVLERKNQDFLLEQGIACLTLPVKNQDNLVSDLRLLKRNYPAVCQQIICRAFGNEAQILLSGCSNNPFLFNMIMVDSPNGYSVAPQVESFPWFYCVVSERFSKDVSLLDGLLEWVTSARDSKYVYPSKIGGLMRVRDNYSSKNLTSFHIPIMMECISFFENLNEHNVRSYVLKKPTDINFDSNKPLEVNFMKGQPDQLDFSKINLLQTELKKLETEQSQAFDCKMVREYRELHADDKSVAQAKNRELILKIGANFEQMGSQVMQEVSEKDPLFYQFYQSLKIIQDQPLEVNE